MPLVLLSACGTEVFRIAPDVISYDKETLNKAADEMEGGSCPVLSNVMMPDYQVMRDQSRIK